MLPYCDQDRVVAACRDRSIKNVSTTTAHSNENDEFPAGEVVELLVGFRVMDADLPFNVSAVYVTLNDPNNHFNYVQNFTVAQYHMPVKTNSEQTVSYSFIPKMQYPGYTAVGTSYAYPGDFVRP